MNQTWQKLFFGMVVMGAATLRADDWPQWFGPQRDGVWRETGILQRFPEGGPKLRWRTEIGAGYAGPSVEKGKVYFDWMQIGEGKTISAPYVVRAYPGAPVATPLAWREVTSRLRPEQFNISNVLDRFDRMGDLFEPVLTRPQKLEPALEKLASLYHPAK